MNLRLGLYLPDFPPTVTPLGITIQTNGLIDYGPKRVRKTCQRMIDAGVATWLIEQFRDWALALPAALPECVDRIYSERIAAWIACAGKRLPDGRVISAGVIDSIKPTTIRIVLHPEPFAVPQGVTAGASWPDHIEVVAAYLGAQRINGQIVENSWLRKCDDLIAYELGNLIGLRCGYRPASVEGEIGNKSPC